MATIGLRDLYYSKITESVGVDGTTTIAYGGPIELAQAISAELSVEVAEAILYANDGIAEVVREFKGGSLKLNIDDLGTTAAADLLGQTADKNKVVFSNSADNAPYVAVGFRARKSNGQYKYVWLLKTKFGIPNESYQTKGESIEFKTPELTATIMTRDDGLWKTDYVGATDSQTAVGWFKNVYAEKVNG